VPPPGVPATASAIAPVAPAGTTLARTLLLGPAGAGGYRPIVAGPGEPHLRRLDLMPATPAGPAGPSRRRPVLALVHLTDVQVLDAQSPARVD